MTVSLPRIPSSPITARGAGLRSQLPQLRANPRRRRHGGADPRRDFALWNSSFFAKPALTGRQDTLAPGRRILAGAARIATCTVWIRGRRFDTGKWLPPGDQGSHKARRLFHHQTNASPELTLNQELVPSEFDERDAAEIVLASGQVSLHDVFLVHGSEPNARRSPRRGMTLRFMPTTSVFDRALAREQRILKNTVGHEEKNALPDARAGPLGEE